MYLLYKIVGIGLLAFYATTTVTGWEFDSEPKQTAASASSARTNRGYRNSGVIWISHFGGK